MQNGTGVGLLLIGGLMPLNSMDLVRVSTFELELERLDTVNSDKEDIEYQVVSRWLRNRISEIERGK